MRLSNLSSRLLHDLVLRHFGSSLVRALQGRVHPLGMRSSEEIEARLRKREEDLDARLALVIARQQERQGVIKDLEAERREAIATGKHGRASAAASGSPQPPISDAAGDDESSKDCPGQVEPSFDSSEVDRLDCVAKCLFKTHGKDAVIKLINALRDTFASNITPTDLQDMGGEDLVKILVQIAADNYVEAAALSEMIARGTRECEE